MFEWNSGKVEDSKTGLAISGHPLSTQIVTSTSTSGPVTNHINVAHLYDPGEGTTNGNRTHQPLINTTFVDFDDSNVPRSTQELVRINGTDRNMLSEMTANFGRATPPLGRSSTNVRSTPNTPVHSPIKISATHSAPSTPAKSSPTKGRTIRSISYTRDINPYHDGKDLFFPLEDVNMESFHNDLPLSPKRHTIMSLRGNHGNIKDIPTIHGKKIRVNGKELALFCYKDKFYATDEKCPHQGGPLHLGDIEDLPGSNSPHLICPWHKWRFDLATGRRVLPFGSVGTCRGLQKNIESYPIRIDNSGKISIGFKAIDPSYFVAGDF